VNAEQLFLEFFWPLYPPQARADLKMARQTDANPGKNPSLRAHLDEAAQAFARNGAALFGADLALDGSDASVHRLGAALTHERRDAWAATGPPGSAANTLFNAVVHGVAYVGACIVANHGGEWSLRQPLWESVVQLRSHAGEAGLLVFQWWLKSLSDDSMGATLADRYRAHVEVPCADPGRLTPMVAGAGDRRLPRLMKPRYDALHKYLRAHVPELRDLGPDFPSPERFEELALRWIDFHFVGDGRMLLLAGVSAAGLHLLWVSAAGFQNGAFFACESGPAPVVRVEPDRVVAVTREGGVTRTHEMLWWGL
jgi:hypothetical protein